MSFHAYLDNIQAKTGKSPEDFIQLAGKKGLLGPRTKAGEVIAWLKKDFALGYGHAMAIYCILKTHHQPPVSREEIIAQHFKGVKSFWRASFDRLLDQLEKSGCGIRVMPTDSYMNLVKGQKKIAVVQVTGKHMDIGIRR